MPAAFVADNTSAAAPVTVATCAAFTAILVAASTVAKFVADADAFVTVTVRALLPFAFARVTRAAKSPSVTVAVIAPVVSASSSLT